MEWCKSLRVSVCTWTDIFSDFLLQKATVSELKKKVEARTGIPPGDQRLIYAGKQLQDNRCLSDYPTLQNGSNIMLVLRLPGGSLKSILEKVPTRPETPLDRKIDSSVPRSNDACMITFLEGESVRMPCGHAISPDGLMDYCWNEVSSGRKSEIHCCLCDSEWPIEVIKRYGGASSEELRMLEEGLSKNYCMKHPDIIECPGCMSLCERKDATNNCVQCLICTRKHKKAYHFCWQCLRPWKSALSAKQCGNTSCNSEIFDKLLAAPETDVIGLKVPSIRACPNCSSLIEHKKGCKQMCCKKCNTDFCFICLRTKTPEGSWTCGAWNHQCKVSPRQTRLPCQTA